MANEQNTGKRTLTPEEKARKVEIQREYMRRKIANETPDERDARLAKQRSHSKAWREKDPDHAKALANAKAKRLYAADPDKFRERNSSARVKSGDKWNATRNAKRSNDPDYLARTKEWANKSRIKHQDARRAGCRDWYWGNKEYSNAQSKAWREANPERHLENAKRWRKENMERVNVNYKAWHAANPDYAKNRYQTDPEFKLACCLRARLVSAVKRQKGRKSAATRELFGCEIAFLREHLEAQFADGMTWENYGTFWHVDHIKPCATFDLTDHAQQHECFHYTNLRPLTAVDNLARPRHPRHYEAA